MSDVANNSDDVAKARRKINGWIFIVILSMTTNVALSIGTIFNDPPVKHVPTRTCKEYSLASKAGDSAYYEQLAYEDALLFFNMTADTVGLSARVLLRRAAPTAHTKLKAWINDQAKEIKTKGYKFVFFQSDIYFDAPTQLAIVRGVQEIRLGSRPVGDPKEVLYGFRYKPETGQLLDIVDLGESK
ncbi:TraE/TraK family type IV conjugative transfer system protein [Aeromonas veronii]|uniref:TraE/TraK family type IV conjugative transfer system protein n=1 Tax=Aeromonas hydrophila TaxID=644 RepID=UPI0010081508|nr:TraE/TraK family type IV conjugative transfer system protein [Aeromonas hydrophila]MBW3834672.1 hypothetical protein [Aeromonas hydrophila]MBW5280302.1 hypothetical protein [Aeromonas hydrophila]